MREWFDLLLSQPTPWRIAGLLALLAVATVIAGAIAAFFEELVNWALGPVRLRILIRRVRREQQRLAREDAERRDRERLNAVIRFPVH